MEGKFGEFVVKGRREEGKKKKEEEEKKTYHLRSARFSNGLR